MYRAADDKLVVEAIHKKEWGSFFKVTRNAFLKCRKCVWPIKEVLPKNYI